MALSTNSRIAKNTIFLYIRMLFVMGINIYAVRVVLNALGVVDYGIYNVVSGFVSSLVFVNSALQSATQRFYSYVIGQNNDQELNNIFSVSMKCYLWVALIFVIVCETLGVWFVNTQLVIPEERMVAANIVFQFTIFSVLFSFLYLPYSSLLIAQEKMSIWTVISMAHSVVLLLLSVLLDYQKYDKLCAYAFFVFLAWLFVFVAYQISCKRLYPKVCKVCQGQSKNLLKDILSFSGWSLYGHLAGVFNNQGNTILLNMFFGPIVNTARAIALQMHTALITFAGNFSIAFRPPIVKCFASNDFKTLNSLYILSNKCIFYCLLMVCLPLYLDVDFVLKVWLSEVSENTALFTQLSIIYAFILSLSAPITTVVQATGRIKKYHLLVETMTLLSMPITYVLFKIGFPSESTFIATIAVFSIAHAIRLYVLSKELKELTILSYLKDFLLIGLGIALLSYFILKYIGTFLSEGWIRLSIFCILSVVLVSIESFTFGFNKSERKEFVKLVKNVVKKCD